MAALAYYHMLSPEVSPTRGGETPLHWETSLAPHASETPLPTTLALRRSLRPSEPPQAGSSDAAAVVTATSSTAIAASKADAEVGAGEPALEMHPLARLRQWEDDMAAAEAELESTLSALEPSARQVEMAAHRAVQQMARGAAVEIASEMQHFGDRKPTDDDTEAMMMRLLLRTRPDGGPPGIAAVVGAPSSAPLLRPWAPHPPGFTSGVSAPANAPGKLVRRVRAQIAREDARRDVASLGALAARERKTAARAEEERPPPAPRKSLCPTHPPPGIRVAAAHPPLLERTAASAGGAAAADAVPSAAVPSEPPSQGGEAPPGPTPAPPGAPRARPR